MANWKEVGVLPSEDDSKWREVGTVTVSAPPADEFASNAGGAAFGRPRRGQATIKEVTPLEAIGAGVTKSIVDPFVGAAQVATGGNLGTSRLAERLGQQGEFYSEVNPTGYMAGRIAGAVVPGTAAVKGAGLLPSVLRNQTANKYLGATALGAGGGFITPEETGKTGIDLYKEQGVKGAIGATLAPVATLGGDVVAKGSQIAKRLIEPFYDSGKDKIVGRALTEAAGGEADKAIANIRNYKPTLAGVEPTMAEVAKVPSLAALERSAITNNPEVSNIIANRADARNLIRKDFIQNLAGMNGEKEALKTARDLTAENNYLKAFNQKTAFKEVPTELLAEKDELLKSPAVQQAVKDASANLANFGQKNINPTQSIQGLHEIKLALDDQIAKLTKPDMKQNEKRKIAGIEEAKKRLLGFLESDAISPAYKKAREVYAAQSKPINELEVIEKIADKVINPNNDAIYATQLARQLKNLEKSGEVGAKKMESLRALQKDIQGQEYAQKVGKATGSDTAQKLAYSNLTSQMGLPNWLSGGVTQGLGNVAGQAGNVFYSNANKELANKLAHVVADPQEAARLMELVRKGATKPSKISPENRKLIELLTSQAGVQYNPFTAEGVTE